MAKIKQPKKYETGRVCARGFKCVGAQADGKPTRLNRYTRPAAKGIYLCNACKQVWADSGDSARVFVGLLSERQKQAAELEEINA